MARGLSLRMGYPKGEALVPGTGLSFLAAVNDIYRQRRLLRMVVTLPELLARYQELLPPAPDLIWVTAAAGGDTALTLRAAWHHLRGWANPPTRVWAHPVDLPLVGQAVLDELDHCALAEPEQAVRPFYDGRPGHPVVIPFTLLNRVFAPGAADEPTGPMRGLLQAQSLPVNDPGVIQDFDDPTSLQEE